MTDLSRPGLGAFWIALLVSGSLFAQQSALPIPQHITPSTAAAIGEGLEWLAAQQDRESGAYGRGPEWSQNVGVSALAGFAFLSSGSTPETGPYAAELDLITAYLIRRAAPNGFISEAQPQTQGPMYGHGFATMYLAEVYGMSRQPRLRTVLRAAVDLILATQNPEGGWRYHPQPLEADLSVTVCQVMALRGARNAGLAVPKEAIDKAVDYIRRCQNPDGGFRYRLHDAAESRFPRSAAAVVALYSAGVATDPAVALGQEYLDQHIPGPRTPRDPQYFYYGGYYGGLAAWQAGGERWEAWYPAARDELLRLRTPAGGWADPWIGEDYATAMALIVLQLPYDRLPVFER